MTQFSLALSEYTLRDQREIETCVGRRMGRSAEAGMFTGMTVGISGEAMGEDGSSAIDGCDTDCVGSSCWHLASNHLAESC